jgi:hypothetical protein
MKNTRIVKSFRKKEKKAGLSQKLIVQVLYQKMGNRWFAFSLIDDEVFFGSISPEEIHQNSMTIHESK